MILFLAATALSTATDRFVQCDCGRVVGGDASNIAIIRGSFKFAALVHGASQSGSVELHDPTPLLSRTPGAPVQALDKGDGKLTLIAPQEGRWTPLLGIDPEERGSSGRVATLMRLDRSSNAFDQSWFYYGHCSITVGADAAKHFGAAQ